ncbi:MAG: hypothetical protein NC489_43920 [Ruminococcus flavefaciens]|nr:hypothetical protein [Ruminococcus flavefaciens]
MIRITFETLIYEAKKEGAIKVSDVEAVIERLIGKDDNEEESDDFKNIDYENHSRGKLKRVAELFADEKMQIFGTADEIHNCAVIYARENMEDDACTILKCGIREWNAAVDLLADYIRYGISCKKKNECEEYYTRLKEIPKEQWNWRAFSFSIDYLMSQIDTTNNEEERNRIKENTIKLADEFIVSVGNDQAYFDKAAVIRKFNAEKLELEKSVLRQGIEQLKVAPKCALRLADILFEEGDYREAAELLYKVCINAFTLQPAVNCSHSFLLYALSKTSELFAENSEGSFEQCEDKVKGIYRDFNTAIESGLMETYKGTAQTAIKIIETQTGYEYPYTNAGEDNYDL